MGRTSGPLLLLLFCAHLYSRVLSMTGFTEAAKSFLLSTGAGPWDILPVMVGISFVLGCLIDSISIMLLTVPIFAPIATHLGLFAWIQWQRRILVRWEYHTPNFLGFVQLACLVILFRRF